MERYIRLFVLGIFMMFGFIKSASATSIATSFQLPLANYPTSDGCLEWGGYNSAFPGQLHVADDACSSAGTNVMAVANGAVKFAGPYKSCSNWGYLIIIEHTLTDGSIVNSIYGHIAPTSGITGGVEVTKGQHIGDIVSMSCWSDHIHFGIYNGPYSEITCSYNSSTGSGSCNAHGYLSDWPGNYLDPTDFIASHQLDCSSYQSEYDAIKDDYGSFIGQADGDPYLYSSVCAQDYDDSGTSDGTSAILFDAPNDARRAYLVRSGFWNHYSTVCGGPDEWCSTTTGNVRCGAPITDEYEQGNGTARQDFQGCYLYWNGSVATTNGYPAAAPGVFDDDGTYTSISYAFAEAYERNGARTTLGEATDIIDGPYVHHWGNDETLPYVQDFDGGSYGWSVIMYNDDMDQAFMITGDIWDAYNNYGPAVYGPPCDDPQDISGGAIQYFEDGIFKWKASTGAVSVSTNPSGCSSYSVSSVSTTELDWDWDGYSEAAGDCDDTADHINPGQPELRDDRDNDCDGLTDETFDLDGDGFSYDAGDCDENRNAVHTGAPELADGLDNDCDGEIDEDWTHEDQYVFFDFDGNGDDDPCVRRSTTLLCLYDGNYGTWQVPGEAIGTGEYIIWRDGRTHYYDYSGADGISDYTLIYGETYADQFLYWHDTIVARFGNQLQIDRNLDGVMDTFYNYGDGNAEGGYYLADVDGNGVADIMVRRQNLFIVDTNSDGVQDFWFTYGDYVDDWYFADFDGDGTDGICVLRGNILHCKNTITRWAGQNADWTYSYGFGL